MREPVVEVISGHITEALGISPDGGGDSAPEEETDAKGAQTQPLDILLRDYYAKVGSSEKLNDGIARMGGTALAIILTVFGLLTVNRTLVAEVYWLIPLVIVFLVGMLMQLVYRSVLISYYIRDLETRIGLVSGTTPFYFENLTGRALYSPRTGAPAFLALYGMYFAVIATAYFGLIAYGFHALHSTFHIPVGMEAGYLGFYGVTTAIMIWALVFYLTGMGPLYDRWSKALDTGAVPGETRALDLIRYALLPRPFDFFVKTPITVGNALLTAYVLHVSLAGHWLPLIGVLICVELFTKQATYIWNDLLDAEADQTHPHKKRRYFAAVGSSAFGKPLLVTRTLCAFAMAAVLAIYVGTIILLPLVVAIFVVQFLYDRYAKPFPPARLGLAAVAYVERSIAGAAVPAMIATARHPVPAMITFASDPLAAMIATASNPMPAMMATASHAVRVVSVLSLWTVTFALLFLSASWRAEDDYRIRTGGTAYAVRQNGRSWFLTYGMRVEVAASLALVPLGVWLSGLRDVIHPRSSVVFLSVGAIGVALVWLLLTLSQRGHRREHPITIGVNGHAPVRDMNGAIPPWSRYTLYIVIAGVFVGYHIAVPDKTPLPFIMAFVFPMTMAAVYAYATYEDLTFLNLIPNLIFTARVLNQIIFTKKHLHDILRDLQSTPPPVVVRSVSSPTDAPVTIPSSAHRAAEPHGKGD